MKQTDTQQRPRSRLVLRCMLVIGALVVAAVFLLPTYTRKAFVDPLSRTMSHLTMLERSLHSYAEYNDGRFPSRLDELVSESLPAASSALKFHDLRTREARDWIYFPGYAVTDPPDTILVASPSVFSKADGTLMVGEGAFRIVLSVDGRRTFLKDRDYQTCIEEQQKPDWRTPKSSAPQDVWHFLSNPAWRAEASGSEAPTRTKVHGPKDIPGLIELLKHGDRRARKDAADALSELGPITPKVVPALLGSLGDSEAGYNSAMGLAAMSLRDQTVVPGLIEILRTRKGHYWAIVALEEIGLANAKAATPFVIEALGSASSDMQVAAAKAVASAGPDAHDAIPQLLALTANGESWACKCAVIALGRIGPQARDAIPSLTAMFDANKDYKIDIVRALWKIDPAQTAKIIPVLIAELEHQRNPIGPNEPMDNDFFSAIELLGETGPDAQSAIPVLTKNLQGGAKLHAAWSLWRINPAHSATVTTVFTGILDAVAASNDRLDQRADGTRSGKFYVRFGRETFVHPFNIRMAAFGALWQIHPEKRGALAPLRTALLREWGQQKVLNELTMETRTVIPALEDLLTRSHEPDILLAREALQKINTTDPGNW